MWILWEFSTHKAAMEIKVSIKRCAQSSRLFPLEKLVGKRSKGKKMCYVWVEEFFAWSMKRETLFLLGHCFDDASEQEKGFSPIPLLTRSRNSLHGLQLSWRSSMSLNARAALGHQFTGSRQKNTVLVHTVLFFSLESLTGDTQFYVFRIFFAPRKILHKYISFSACFQCDKNTRETLFRGMEQ